MEIHRVDRARGGADAADHALLLVKNGDVPLGVDLDRLVRAGGRTYPALPAVISVNVYWKIHFRLLLGHMPVA